MEDHENVPTYVRVEVDNGKLQVSEIRAGDNLGPNSAVDFNTSADSTWTGVPANLSSPAQPDTGLWPNNPNQRIPAPNPLGGIGTQVDSFTLHVQNANN